MDEYDKTCLMRRPISIVIQNHNNHLWMSKTCNASKLGKRGHIIQEKKNDVWMSTTCQQIFVYYNLYLT